jgi:FtsP/CotA-like multicopper oxidase with cupredoxin domain
VIVQCPPAASVANAPLVVANDNRVAAGRMLDGVLHVTLVARAVSWKPDGPTGCALAVHAFAEEGKPPRIPGPLLRVRSGTALVVRVRNTLDSAIWVRGLEDRPTVGMDSTEITAGATHEFRFRATAPGAWYYWAGAAGRTAATFPISTEDGQLAGALIVDPADGPTHDRVFVMTRWTPRGRVGNADRQVNAINGRSWPSTERLTYTSGDTIRWHVVNASDELHMMHLHGFYFRVDERGDVAHDSALARARQASVVTTATRRGEWISISWAPERAGNWLFHCHFVAHMSGAQRVGANHVHATSRANIDSAHDMAGLILGVTVRPRGDAPRTSATRVATTSPARRLRLFADQRSHAFGDRPGYGFVLQEGDHPPARDSIVVPGTPIVLTRDEPVAITVLNRTTSTFGVHWHGIELESYFDGVAGWSGAGGRIAPAISPGDSFVARFTPPRAGTFIYHVHNEPGDELASGLYAPLLVLPPGAKFDPERERIIVVATGGPGIDPPPAVNGKTTPDTILFTADRTYTVRIIDISSNEANLIELRGPSGTATWRQIGRDGKDLPESQRTVQPARTVTASGVTMDFELSLPQPGEYSIALTRVVGGRPLSQSALVVPVRVQGR